MARARRTRPLSDPDPRVGIAGCTVHRPAAFGGAVEIVAADRTPRGFGPRLNATLGVCLKYGPAHNVVSDGRKLSYPADSMRIRMPGCVWASAIAPVGFLALDIAPSLLPEGLVHQPMRFLRRELPDLQAIATTMERGSTALARDSALTGLLQWLSEHGLLDADGLHEDGNGRRAVRQAREYLRASLASNPGLDELARVTGSNKFVLIRWFKREVGIGPHGYLVRLRVERARELLARGDAPVDVAAEVGFADQAHLGRHFVR